MRRAFMVRECWGCWASQQHILRLSNKTSLQLCSPDLQTPSVLRGGDSTQCMGCSVCVEQADTHREKGAEKTEGWVSKREEEAAFPKISKALKAIVMFCWSDSLGHLCAEVAGISLINRMTPSSNKTCTGIWKQLDAWLVIRLLCSASWHCPRKILAPFCPSTLISWAAMPKLLASHLWTF